MPLILVAPYKKTVIAAALSGVSLLMHFDHAFGDSLYKFKNEVVENPVTTGVDLGVTISNEKQLFGKNTAKLTGIPNQGLYVGTNNIYNLGNAFTIEGWYFPTSLPAAGTFGTLFNIGGGLNLAWCSQLLYLSDQGKLIYCASSTNSGYDIANSVDCGTAVLNQWNHYSITRVGSDYIFHNHGVAKRIASTIYGPYTPPNAMTIGGYPENNWNTMPKAGFKGYLGEFRITKSVRYSVGNIAVPTAAFGNSTTDSYWASVLILMRMTGTENGAWLSSTNAEERNNYSVAQNSSFNTTQSFVIESVGKFGNAGFYATGASHIKAPNCAGFGTNDFTVEFFYRRSANIPSTHVIFDSRSAASTTAGITIMVDASGFPTVTGGGINLVKYSSAVPTTYVHIAFVRYGNNYYLYVDGIRAAAYSGTIFNFSNPDCFIGGDFTDGARMPTNTYLDELRVTRGQARYTGGTYTVPTAPFALAA